MTKELLFLLFTFLPNSYLDLLPSSDSKVVVNHHYYSLSFNPQYMQAEWVAYSITDSTAFGGVKRTNNFRDDDALPDYKLLDDYVNSGYDRGHLCPAGSMAFNSVAMSESFFMTNMSPQKPGFNRGIWKKLESQVRTWGYENKVIYVVTGPVLNSFVDTIGEIPVPEYFYKVILDIDTPEVKSIAFILENESSSEPLWNFVVSIDSVEMLTGIDFFPEIPDSLEEFLESQFDIHQWSWSSINPEKRTISKERHFCSGFTKEGKKCSRTVSGDNQFCWQHLDSTEQMVYVCGKSKIYHISSSHAALKRCKSGIREIPLSEAEAKGLRPCKE